MSNPAHEALLRQGLAEWNEWRRRNRSVIPDLRGLAMSAANLSGADLSHASLSGAVLIRTKLAGADLRYADLRGAQLHEADFTDADLYHANLEGAALPGAKLRRTRLGGARLSSAAVTMVDFRSANLSEADLTRADLRESQGAGATLERAKLDGAELFGCRLNGANLRGATGISARQLEEAIIDDLTSLPEGFAASTADPTIQSLCGALESMKARSTGSTVPENEVSSYHALLHMLESQGIPTEGARIDENAPGTSLVDAALFKSRIDSVLEGLRRKL